VTAGEKTGEPFRTGRHSHLDAAARSALIQGAQWPGLSGLSGLLTVSVSPPYGPLIACRWTGPGP